MTFLIGKEKSSFFLIIIIIGAILVSIPIISNHFLHPEHYFHIAVHEASFVLAMFLFAMAIIAYKKTKITRMIFSAGAFLVLGISQIGFMLEKINIPAGMHIEDIAEEHFDIGILIMTILFAFGVFWKR